MKQAGRWCLVGLLGLLVLVDAVVVCAITVKGIRTGTWPDDLTAIICLVTLGVAMGYFARLTEHDLRPRHRRQRASKVRAERRPPNRAVRTVLAALLLAGFLAYTPTWIGHSWANWRRSVETQDHGLPSTLTVDRVIHAYHSTGRGGHYYTVHLQGELDPPLEGRTRTTVYIPQDATYANQGKIRVLVDPDDLGYAERVGIEDSSAASAIFAIVLAGFCDLFLALVVVGPFIHLRRKRT